MESESPGEPPAGLAGISTELTVDEAMEVAVDLHRKGFAKAAEEIYNRVLSIVPDHVDALNFLGIACSQLGRGDQALELLRRAVALAPGNADARNNLGSLFLQMGALEEAEEAYQAVLALRPDNVSAHTNLGTIRKRKGDLVGAEAVLRHALEIDPEHGEAHHQLGSVLWRADRMHEALSAFRRALTLRPYNGEAYRRVGFVLAALDRRDEAVELYERWLKLDPGNPIASHHLAGCTGRDVAARASDEYIQSTFDGFAGSFDDVLKRLEYRAPQLVADAVAAVVGLPQQSLDVLDAGAGTGLCGPGLRPYARHLVAVDLSPRMLEKASARAVYDDLDAVEVTGYMRARPASFDLIVSGDTLVYFGDLEAVLAAAAVALRPGGHLVFTLEHAADEPAIGYRLNPHGRYSHGRAYVRRALETAGLTPLSLLLACARNENQIPVEGIVVTARRGTPSPKPPVVADQGRSRS
jgi:predicted TPR repeat methyltransferase